MTWMSRKGNRLNEKESVYIYICIGADFFNIMGNTERRRYIRPEDIYNENKQTFFGIGFYGDNMLLDF